MKLGISGSRRRNTQEDKQKLKELIQEIKPDELISGGCPLGADKFAEELSEELNIPIKIFYPEKVEPNSPYYKHVQSFFKRNKQIAESSDRLIAVVSSEREKTGGTENTIKHMKKLKKPILII